MGLSSFSYICITNNPALKGIVKSFEFMDALSLDVLKKGRDLVQSGWELLASPFYGNFKPNQQPYRTLVLRKNNGGNGGLPDAQSLSLIEDSVRFYENFALDNASGPARRQHRKRFPLYGHDTAGGDLPAVWIIDISGQKLLGGGR